MKSASLASSALPAPVDRLLDDLHQRIAERRQVVAQQIDAGLGRLGLVLLHELAAGVRGEARPRQPEVVDHDAVQQRPELRLDGRRLQADHAAADTSWA